MIQHPSRRTVVSALLSATATAALPIKVRAQEAYPTRPINFIVASVAGGILDTIGRIVARGLEKMGQPVVVENIAGAGSTLGTAAAVRAKADGYTVCMVATSHAINPSVYAKLPYDTKRDLQPISHAVNLINVLGVGASVPAKTLQEFIDLAKKKPGELTFGSAGNGQSNHLSGELFSTAAGIRMIHVPYKGSAAALVDVIGGNVNSMFVDVLSAVPYIESGKMRALAVSGNARQPALPNVPTFAEAGLPNFNANSWLGIVTKAGTPPEIVAKLGAAAAAVMQDPAVRARLIAMGVQPVGSTPEEFTKFLDAEIDRYAAAVKAAGITPQ